MKKLSSGYSLAVLASLSALVASGGARAADYTVDKDHSHVGFRVRHMVSRLPGEFRDFSGEFSFDAKKPEAARAKFAIHAASISTNNEKRDHHLRDSDFFEVNKYPTITFESTRVTPAGEGRYKLAGNMTLHGVTK